MIRHWSVLKVVGVLAAVAAPVPAAAQAVTIAGNLAIQEKGGKRSADVGQAVIWLEGGKATGRRATRVDIVTQDKQFSPRVVVVPAGSTIGFPNHDPFNHNVFSVSESGPFDLGQYGRGDTRTVELKRAGVVRVYCNIHARMAAFVVVRNEAFVTQPASDGRFELTAVPPGTYTLHAWHERGGELSQPLEVPPAGVAGLRLELDASKFKYTPHLNKFQRPYADEGRRY
jgi:plastocyanin